jgi:small subunit ribosomal protein S19
MSRSLKKGPFMDPKLWEKIQKSKPGGSAIKTWSRDSTIFPEMVGMKFEVHNGRTFITVLVSENMVGHKLGEFAPTRKFIRHGGKMAKEATAIPAAGAAPAAATPAGKK